jgi:6-phosphogluconolactonase
MPTVTKVHPSKASLASTLCSTLVSLSRTSIADHGSFTLALSGGSVPGLLSHANMKIAFEEAGAVESYASWHVLLADERVVPADHADSNMKALMSDSFVKPMEGVQGPASYASNDPGSTSPSDDVVKSVAAAYASTVASTLAAHSSGVFDCVVLGMGEDGHTASLFPGHKLLGSTEEHVDYIMDSPKAPPERITLTFPSLNKARNVVFAASGGGKADVVSKFFAKTDAGDLVLADQPVYPCAMVRNAGELIWLLDESAVAQVELRSAL